MSSPSSFITPLFPSNSHFGGGGKTAQLGANLNCPGEPFLFQCRALPGEEGVLGPPEASSHELAIVALESPRDTHISATFRKVPYTLNSSKPNPVPA